jgi:hypothetical protein
MGEGSPKAPTIWWVFHRVLLFSEKRKMNIRLLNAGNSRENMNACRRIIMSGVPKRKVMNPLRAETAECT